MVCVLFGTKCYSYPLKKTAIVLGSLTLALCFLYTTWVISIQLNNGGKSESGENPLSNDDDFHPLLYKSTSGLILGSILGYSVCIASALVILGAIKKHRFLLLPYVILQCFAMLCTIIWFIISLATNDFHKYDMMWFGFIFMQVQLTISIFRHFQELSETESPPILESNLPYDRMANAI